MEIWRDVIGFECLYQVSTNGRVRSYDRAVAYPRGQRGIAVKKGKVLSPKVTQTGYYEVVLIGADGARHSKRVHRLVAEAFIPNPDKLPYINHIDENKQNNNVTNLEWCTPKHNSEEYTRKRCLFTQCDLSGNFIKDWNSMTEAALAVKGTKHGISKCCAGKLKTYRGFIWKYKEKNPSKI